MAKGVNKAILIGTLGQDPEIKYTASGSAVVNLSVATNETWKDKYSGEKQERADWHRITLYGRLAEIAGEYLQKGSQAYFEGRLQTRKWQDQNGNDRYTTEISANEMQMLGSRQQNAQPTATRDQAEQYRQASGGTAAGGSDSGFEDIPFGPAEW